MVFIYFSDIFKVNDQIKSILSANNRKFYANMRKKLYSFLLILRQSVLESSFVPFTFTSFFKHSFDRIIRECSRITVTVTTDG